MTGAVKAVTNLLAGALPDPIGRKPVAVRIYETHRPSPAEV
jgi:hypothetical protein